MKGFLNPNLWKQPNTVLVRINSKPALYQPEIPFKEPSLKGKDYDLGKNHNISPHNPYSIYFRMLVRGRDAIVESLWRPWLIAVFASLALVAVARLLLLRPQRLGSVLSALGCLIPDTALVPYPNVPEIYIERKI